MLNAKKTKLMEATNQNQLNAFDRQLVEKSKRSTYKDLFRGVYGGSKILMIICLAFSAGMSSKFYVNYLGWLGEYADYAGLLAGGLVAFGIFRLDEALGKYRQDEGMNEPTLTPVFWFLVGLSVVADLAGGGEWGKHIVGDAPADTKTSEVGGIYTPQIASIDKEIESIEAANFYWCGVHNRAHKCDKAQFYIDPKGDKKNVARIEELKEQKAGLQSTMNGLLADASKVHSQVSEEYFSTLDTSKTAMRGAGVVAVILALVCGNWRVKYEVKAASEIEKKANTPQHATNTPNTAQHGSNTPTKLARLGRATVLKSNISRVNRVKKQSAKVNTEELAKTVKDLEERLAQENRALKEDKQAMHEELQTLKEFDARAEKKP